MYRKVHQYPVSANELKFREAYQQRTFCVRHSGSLFSRKRGPTLGKVDF